jgi:hypothetical protein
MKKITFYLLVILGLIISSQSTSKAQLLKPFPDSTGAWIISYGSMFGHGSYRYYINGDTIINSIKYNKLFTGVNNLNDSSDLVVPYFVGIFRTDSNKVFYKNINQYFEMFGFVDTNEVLLYDFDMIVGDSIKNYNDGIITGFIKVSSIDTIILGVEHLKQWHFTTSSPNSISESALTWIEGIGSKIGFFTYFLEFESSQGLACYHANNTDYVINLGNATSCLTVGIENVQKDNFFDISPNPFSQSTQITLNKTYHNIALAVYDSRGKQVAQQQYKDCDKIQLSRNQLSNGLYFLKLTLDDKAVETGKMVISEK